MQVRSTVLGGCQGVAMTYQALYTVAMCFSNLSWVDANAF